MCLLLALRVQWLVVTDLFPFSSWRQIRLLIWWQGNTPSREALSRICHFQICENSFLQRIIYNLTTTTKKVHCLEEAIKKGNSSLVFYYNPQSWQSIAKNIHHAWRIQTQKELKLWVKALDTCLQDQVRNFPSLNSTSVAVLFILFRAKPFFFQPNACLSSTARFYAPVSAGEQFISILKAILTKGYNLSHSLKLGYFLKNVALANELMREWMCG